MKLPAPPRTLLVNGERLASHEREGGLDLLLARKQASLLVHVQPGVGQSQPEPVLEVRLSERECILRNDAKLAVCVSASPSESGTGCSNMPARVELAKYGEVTQDRVAVGRAFWTSAALADVDAPSAEERTRRALRLRCGEQGWEKLRKALEAFCAAGSGRGSDKRQAFCAAEQEGSLLFQSTRCTNLPGRCPPSRRAIVPSVDRRQFERGERVELSSMSCTVWFSRKADEFHVIDHECAGD